MNISFKNRNDPIIRIEIDNNESDYLNLITDKGYKFKLQAYGDCCSTSYISMYKENFNYLIGKIIKSIKEINLPDDFEETESENEDCNVITTHLYEIKFCYN